MINIRQVEREAAKEAEIARLRAKITEVAAFLDLMAKRIDRIRQGRSIDSGMRAAADCRATAAKLRGET